MSRARNILLAVDNLKTYFYTDSGLIKAVDGATFAIEREKTLAIVGESGCGKSVTAFSLMQLIQKPGRIVEGTIRLYSDTGKTYAIEKLDEKQEEIFKIRGNLISMIFQEPMTALSPVHTIGNQIIEAIQLHQDVSKEEARETAIRMLDKVGIPGASKRIDQYPHEISGGMRQRVVIAIALVCRPELLIADEPTTALDVTIQAQILRLIKDMQKELKNSILLITHNLGIVAQESDYIAVMYLGRIIEYADVRTVLRRPAHPYTRALLRSLPSISARDEELPTISGSVPSMLELPMGCPFHPRCEYFKDKLCNGTEAPPLAELNQGHQVACFRAKEIYSG